MGLFRSKPIFRDRLWTSQELKERDIIRSVQNSIAEGHTPLTVVHFYESIEGYNKLFANNDLRVRQLQGLSELDVISSEPGSKNWDVILMDSDLIRSNTLKSFKKESKEIRYDLHLLERYPLPEPDQRVLELANIRFDFSPPTAYVSLDEPWITVAMGERLIDVLDRLGLDHNEVIEHSMISSSLRRAQRKMAEKVVRDFPQDSQEKWLQFNLKT